MKPLTPADLVNTKRKSGYDHVAAKGNGADRSHGGGLPFAAEGGGRKEINGIRAAGGSAWHGPRRATALEAAQDYCDYVNSGQVNHPGTLKSANHQRPQQPKRRVPSDIAAARGMIRDYEAQQRQGVQGYVYCISDGTAVKIGYSVNPQKRVPELQTGNPRVLTLLGVLKGTEADERRLHRKFRKQNILQEWFHPTDEVLSMFGIKQGAQTGRMSCSGPNFNTMPKEATS